MILFSQYLPIIFYIFKTIQKLYSSWHSLWSLWNLLCSFIVWIHLFVLIIFFYYLQLYNILFILVWYESLIFIKPIWKGIIQLFLFFFQNAYFWHPIHLIILDLLIVNWKWFLFWIFIIFLGLKIIKGTWQSIYHVLKRSVTHILWIIIICWLFIRLIINFMNFLIYYLIIYTICILINFNFRFIIYNLSI